MTSSSSSTAIRELKPADEPILEKKFAALPGARSVTEWLAFLRRRVTILNELSLLQMREFMLDSEPRAYRRRRGRSSSATIPARRCSRSPTARSGRGRPQGPVADGADRAGLDLRRGRPDLGPQARRHGPRRRGRDLIEIPRIAALKLMATNSAAKREITRIATERHAAADVRLGPHPRAISTEVLESAEIKEISAGEAIINEGDEGYDIFVIRQGSMVVEKSDRRQAGLPLLPARRLLCRRDGADRRRPAHRDGARRDQVRGDQARRRRLPQRCSRASPTCSSDARTTWRTRQRDQPASSRRSKDGFGGVVDMYSSVAGFLV